MSVLTEQQLIDIRREVGPKPADADIQAIFDRTDSIDETINEILDTRLAGWLAEPASFTVVGEYSQDRKANIDALTKKLRGRGAVTLVEPDDCRPR